MGKFHFDLLAPIYDKLIKPKRPTALLMSIDRHLPMKESYNVLEIGGGTGRLAQYFVGSRIKLDTEKLDIDKKYKHALNDEFLYKIEGTKNTVVIIDPSKRMLLQAEKKNIGTLIEGYAEDLPFEENSFDLIIVSDSLHHWAHHQQAFEEISRVLSKEGVLAIEEINPQTSLGKLIMTFEKISLMGSKFFTPDQSTLMLKQVKLNVEEVTFHHGSSYQLIVRHS